MDKKTVIGIILIIIITLLMPLYQKWITGDKPIVKKSIQQPLKSTPDSSITASKETLVVEEAKPSEFEPQETEIAQPEYKVSINESSEERIIEIESDLFSIIWSTRQGGNPINWKLKHYGHFSGGPVDLIDKNRLNINFLNVDGKEIQLNDYNWFCDFTSDQKITLDKNNPEIELKFYLLIENGRIIKTVRFQRSKYSFEVFLTFENLHNYLINRRYFIAWDNGLPLTEKNKNDDNSYARAYAYMAEELESLDASDEKLEENDYNGEVDWMAARTKYFLVAIVPVAPERTNGAIIAGRKEKINGDQDQKRYSIAIDAVYYPEPTYSDSFLVYLGPLDYYELKKYNEDLQILVMNKDWYERLFRPISLLIIPAFKFLYRFIPNYGVVIIIFSILVKLLLYPLTKKSYKSMSEMQFLQPKMAEIREKYKNDPQRMNKEVMKLYKEHGVNPLGGCLPMLLQMPLLFALFIVFRSTIQLRGKPFILWINDLSQPDALHLGVNLPLIGDNIHVLPILMGLTMIWQSKMSMTDPKQKMMVYFMPIFMVFIFYSLPSGLNLYYALFNVLSMIQTHQIKKKMHPEEKAPKIMGKPEKTTRNKGGKKK